MCIFDLIFLEVYRQKNIIENLKKYLKRLKKYLRPFKKTSGTGLKTLLEPLNFFEWMDFVPKRRITFMHAILSNIQSQVPDNTLLMEILHLDILTIVKEGI